MNKLTYKSWLFSFIFALCK